MTATGITQQSSAKCCFCGSNLVQVASTGNIWWCLTDSCRTEQLKYGLSRDVWVTDDRGKTAGVQKERLFVPTPRQVHYMRSPAKYRLFGGAAGPGKSTATRLGMYRKACAIPGYEGLILRETFPELEKTHLRKMAREVEWFGDNAEFIESKRLMKFYHKNGPTSLIECGHMDDEKSLNKYLSTEYDEIAPDEASRYKPDHVLELSTRCRSTKDAVLKAGGPWFNVVSNPGGPASDMLYDLFIAKEIDAEKYPILAGNDSQGQPFYLPSEWEFIPATLDDNPYLPPGYERTLAVLQPWRYRQLRYGDWLAKAGIFFANWMDAHHTREVEITDPRNATWFRALDWGFHDPTVIGWFVALPDGHYHCVRELKIRETLIVDVVKEVQAIDRSLGLPTPVSATRTYADPATRQRGGQTGESIAETFAKCGMPLIPSVNERVNGWMRVQGLLKDAPDGVPYLTFDPCCKYLRRSMASAMSDDKNPDDIDQSMDDHGLDMIRYFAMSRPAPQAPKARDPLPKDSAGALLEEAMAEITTTDKAGARAA